MAKVSSSNTTTLYSTTQTTPILPGASVATGPVNTTNFTTLYSQTNGVPGGGASDDLLVKGNLRVLGTSDLEGRVTIGNSYSLPTADGTANQVMVTDGNGNVTFEDATAAGKTYDISAASTTGGANFNLNSDLPSTDTIKFSQGSGISVTATSANEITIASTTPGTTYDFNASSATGGANLNLVGSDSTTDTVKLTDGGHITATYTSATEVTLGSDATDANTANAIVSRDASGNFVAGQGSFDSGVKINGSTSGSSTFTAPATGSTLSYVLPGTAGAASTVLTNDGSGTLSWDSVSPGATYTIDASTTTGGANFNLQNGGTDTIKFAEGSNVTITATSANEITISAAGSAGTFGNLSVGVSPDLNSIKSTDTNGNIILEPNGTGDVYLNADTVRVGDSNTDATVTTNGTGDLILNTNNGTNSGQIRIFDGLDQPIDIQPAGLGDVRLLADTVVIGDSNVTATITTVGTGNLVLNTNSGIAGTGNITINQGANANIEINPNGTGDVQLNADTVRVGDSNATATITSNGTGDLVLNTNAGTNSGNITITQGLNANISITPNGAGDVQLNADTVRIGDNAAAATITTQGAGNLTLNTNSGTTSGSITINQGVNGAISIVPHSSTPGTTGDINLTSDKVVVGDGFGNGFITTTSNVSLLLQGDNFSGGQISLGNFGTGGAVSLISSSTSSYINLQSNATIFGRNETAGNPAYIGTSSRSGVIPSTANDLIIQTGDPYFPLVYSSGNITIIAGANGNISLTPNGTGRTSITNGTIANNLQFNGSTSGTVEFAASAVAGTQAYTLPTALPGVSGYVLSSDTSGVMSWVDNTSTSTFGNLSIGVVTPNTIASTDTDGPIILAPDGLGIIELVHGDPTAGAGVQVGNGTDFGAIFSNGATDLILSADISNIAGPPTITLSAAGEILLLPRTGSTVDIESFSTRFGDGATAATLTSIGAQNLVLGTDAATVGTSPLITLTQAGGITLQATAATNAVAVVNSLFQHAMNSATTGAGTLFAQAHATADANNFSLIRARGTTTSPSAVQTGDELAEFVVGGHDGQTGAAGYEPAWGFTTTVTATPSSNVMPVRTDYVINTAASTLSTYHSISDDLVFRVVELGTVSGVTDLFVSAGTNGNVEIAPDGTGSVLLTTDLVELSTGNITTTGNTGIPITMSVNDVTWGTSTVTIDEDITLDTDTNGQVIIASNTTRVGNLNTDHFITTNGIGNLNLSTNKGVNSGQINIQAGGGGDIEIRTDTTGNILLNADTIRVGQSGVAATITTYGAGNLVLNTNEGTNSGSVVITQGVNGQITLAPNGAGDIQMVAGTTRLGLGNLEATLTTNGTGNLVLRTNQGGTSGNITINQGADANIEINPNGTGDVQLNADTVRIGDSGAEAILTTNGSGGLRISTNDNSTTGYIAINSGADGNITLEPNGTGDVFVISDTLRVGDNNAQARITTFGTGNLLLNTNNGTNTGSITIAQGVNGNMTLACNGSGSIVASSPLIGILTGAPANAPAIRGRHSQTIAATEAYPAIDAQKQRSDITFASMTSEPAVYSFSVRDSTNTNRTFGRWIGRFAGTSTNPSFELRGSPDGFTTTVSYVTFGGAVGTFGNASSNYTITSNTGGNLILTANADTTSGTVTIASGANANISLTPNGTGRTDITNGTFINPLRLATYTAAGLTALTGAVGDIAVVTDSGGGGNPNGMVAFWDTTNARWSYVHDNSAV